MAQSVVLHKHPSDNTVGQEEQGVDALRPATPSRRWNRARREQAARSSTATVWAFPAAHTDSCREQAAQSSTATMQAFSAAHTDLVQQDSERYRQQHARITAICTRMNAGWSLGVRGYNELFGYIGADHNDFGDRVWQALPRLWQRYPHRDRMLQGGGTVCMGWFACPVPFSRAGAQQALHQDGYREFYYPAVFVLELEGDAASMACAHILLQWSKPWPLDRSRIFNERQLTDAELQLA